MKVAVYAIAKNESNNIDGWYKNVSNADYVMILDTGSADDTVDKARSLGINVFEASISPWDEARAKNVAMSLLPKDIDFCICIDLDEHVSDLNWKDSFFDGMQNGMYITTSIGSDGLNKFYRPVRNVHPRFGYYWKGFRAALTPYPKYEMLVDNPQLGMSTIAMVGDQDRFDNRDPLYVESFLNHVLMLEDDKKQIGSRLQTALAYLALSYYEIEDYYNFTKTFNIFSKNIEDLSAFDSKLPFVEVLDYAAAMVMPESAESTYLSWIEKSQNPIIPISRLIIFLTISEQKEKAAQYLSKYVSAEDSMAAHVTPDTMDARIFVNESIKDSLEVCRRIVNGLYVSENEKGLLLNVYSAIGWGKPHKDLALKAIDYGKI